MSLLQRQQLLAIIAQNLAEFHLGVHKNGCQLRPSLCPSLHLPRRGQLAGLSFLPACLPPYLARLPVNCQLRRGRVMLCIIFWQLLTFVCLSLTHTISLLLCYTPSLSVQPPQVVAAVDLLARLKLNKLLRAIAEAHPTKWSTTINA